MIIFAKISFLKDTFESEDHVFSRIRVLFFFLFAYVYIKYNHGSTIKHEQTKEHFLERQDI